MSDLFSDSPPVAHAMPAGLRGNDPQPQPDNPAGFEEVEMFKPCLKPEAETKPDPFSLDALIAWLRTKNSAETYCYSTPETCLIGQYVQESAGFYSSGKYRIGGDEHPTSMSYDISPEVWESRPLRHIAIEEPHTFGAALDRALVIKARQS